MKGFTLIELLAVIAIMAIVLLISVPIITGVIEKAKVDSVISTNKMLLKGIEVYLIENENLLPVNIGAKTEVPLQTLISGNYVSSVKSPFNNNDCTGYFLVTKTVDGFKTTPYVNCLETINNSTNDRLALNYTFDDFQEPTENLINSMVVGGHGSSYTLQSALYNGSPVYRNLVTTPSVGNNFGFRSSTNLAIDPLRQRFITISFDNKVDVSPGPMYGYVRVMYTDATETTHNWSYQPNTWHNVDTDYKKVVATIALTNGKTPDRITMWYVYKDNALVGDMLVSNLQMEQKPYATPFVNGTRTGIVSDYSANSNTSTMDILTTPRWLNNNERKSGVYSFNGTSQHIALPNDIVPVSAIRTNGITYSAWVNTSSITTQRIVGQQISDGYSDYSSGGIGLDGSGRPQMIAYSDSGPAAYVYSTASTVLQTGKWNHIVGTFDQTENKIKIYVNGKLEGQPGNIGVFSRLQPNNSNRIGNKHNVTSNNFNGMIDDVRIYNRSLSEKEIKILYELSK